MTFVPCEGRPAATASPRVFLPTVVDRPPSSSTKLHASSTGGDPMDLIDDNLEALAAHGAALPPGGESEYLQHDGARIWYAAYGAGPAVILLHGGMGHSGNWAYQIPAVVASGRRAIVIDSRGHGRSTRDARPFSYGLMAGDVLAVMDALGLKSSPIVGWSDGACIGLVLARREPARVAGLLFFACNVDPTGTKPFVMTPVIERCITRHRLDYAALSPTPDAFDALGADLMPMQRDEPNYGPDELASIGVPVTVVQSE